MVTSALRQVTGFIGLALPLTVELQIELTADFIVCPFFRIDGLGISD